MKISQKTSISLILLVLLAAEPVLAAVKDTDADNLTDDSETGVYHTDPNLFDTDGDGVGDGEEVLDSTNPLDPESSHLATLQQVDEGIMGERDKRAWYLGRASGIAAFILLSLVAIHGLLMSGRVWNRLFRMATVYETHRYLAVTAIMVTILHFSSFFFDNYLNITVKEALVPFLLERPFRTVLGFDIGLTVGFGIVALYLGIVIVLTSLYRHKFPVKWWRASHYLTFVFYILFLLHGLASGSDSESPWMQGLYAGSLGIILFLVLVRIFFRNIKPLFTAPKPPVPPPAGSV